MSTVVAFSAALLLVVAQPQTASASTTDTDTIFTTTNAARASNAHGAFVRSASLDSVAQAWAEHMGAAGVMSHNPDLASQIPAGWSHAGENVATGYAADQVLTAWMNSPHHRANILNDYTDIGIGYFVDQNGTAWAVQDFGRYSHAAAAAPSAAVQPAATHAAPPRARHRARHSAHSAAHRAHGRVIRRHR